MAHILQGNAARETLGRELGENVRPVQVARVRGHGCMSPRRAIRQRHRIPRRLLEGISRSAALCCPIPLLNSLFRAAMSTVRLDLASCVSPCWWTARQAAIGRKEAPIGSATAPGGTPPRELLDTILFYLNLHLLR